MTIWNPGDLALCIHSGPWWEHDDVEVTSPCPEKGRVYTVEWAGEDRYGEYVLYLIEFDQSFWEASCFRKIAGNVELLSKREREWVLRDEPEKESV